MSNIFVPPGLSVFHSRRHPALARSLCGHLLKTVLEFRLNSVIIFEAVSLFLRKLQLGISQRKELEPSFSLHIVSQFSVMKSVPTLTKRRRVEAISTGGGGRL